MSPRTHRRLFGVGMLVALIGLPSLVQSAESQKASPQVPLDLFVMSQCPWGVKAENVVFPVVKSLAPHVELRLNFIGDIQPSPDGDVAKTKFTAMHGEPEVQENLRQLCASKLFPAKYMDYIEQRNQNIMDPNWKDAATRAGLKPEALEKCAAGPEGAALMTENLKVHKARNASASPTIFIDGTLYTGARGPKSMTLALCQALQAKGVTPPEACKHAESLPPDPVPMASGCGAQAAAPAAGGCGGGGAGGCGGGGGCGGAAGGCGGCGGGQQGQQQVVAGRPRAANDLSGIGSTTHVFPIDIVIDPSCPQCRARFEEPLRRIFPQATFRTLDADSKDGKALMQRLDAKYLPLYALDSSVENASNFGQAKRMLIKVADRFVVRPEFVQPTVRLERPRVANHLDVFVNSLSSVTPLVESELVRFFSQTAANDLTFSLHFVAQEAAREPEQGPKAPEKDKAIRAASPKELQQITPGPLFTVGGEHELKESVRQLCLFQHASMGDFFTYLACRNQDLQNPKRAEQCLMAGQTIQACISGAEGEQLLREDARMARSLGIATGPMVLWENRYGPFWFDEIDSLEGLVGGSGQ